MKNHEARVYSVSDFLEWHRNGLLKLDPDFQRRPVWSEKAKSYLVDTILRGKPIPPVFVTEHISGGRTVHVVVDGQQRLRAIIGFVEGDFTVSRAHNEEIAGIPFSDLPPEVQNEFYRYGLAVNLLYDMTYAETLDVFARINSYTVPLSPQEKLNAKYLGYFKQTAFRLGHRYAGYFVDGGILTKAKISRMAEADLASDLLVALMDGVQTDKNIEQFYKRYEDDPGELEAASRAFESTMSYISAIYPAAEISTTNWSRVHLFYTVFTSIAHLQNGLVGLDPLLRRGFGPAEVGKIRVRLDEISATYNEVAKDPDNDSRPVEYRRFIEWSRRATTDTATRVNRSNFVCRKLLEVL